MYTLTRAPTHARTHVTHTHTYTHTHTHTHAHTRHTRTHTHTHTHTHFTSYTDSLETDWRQLENKAETIVT